MLEGWIEHWTYLGVFLLLMAGGFGAPIPEDIPLIMGGYLCAEGLAKLTIMLPLTLITVIGGDSCLYWIGHHFGRHVVELKFFGRLMTPARLAKVEMYYHRHGGKALFIARFLPGLRTVFFMAAGMFHIPYWKMLVFDGTAAFLSVPTLVIAGWYFHDDLDKIRYMSGWAQIGLLGGIAAVLGIWWEIKRRRRKAELAVVAPNLANPAGLPDPLANVIAPPDEPKSPQT